MLHSGRTPQVAFHAVLQVQLFGMGERIERQPEHLVERGVEIVIGRQDDLPIRIHTSNISSAQRPNAARVDSSEMRVKGLFVASLKMRACGAPT